MNRNSFSFNLAVSARKCFQVVKTPTGLCDALINLIDNNGVVSDEGIDNFVNQFIKALRGAGLDFDDGKFRLVAELFTFSNRNISAATVQPILKGDYEALAKLFNTLSTGTATTDEILADLAAYVATEVDVVNALTNNQHDAFVAAESSAPFQQLFTGFMAGFQSLAQDPTTAWQNVQAGKNDFSHLMTLFLQALAKFNA